MKTITFKDIWESSYAADTIFVLASEAEAEIYWTKQCMELVNLENRALRDGIVDANERIEAMRERQRVLVNSLDRVTAYYEGCLNGVTTDNYQDVIDEARARIAAKEG